MKTISFCYRQRRTYILRFNPVAVLGRVDRKQLPRILHFGFA
jgi:hypothetical protein